MLTFEENVRAILDCNLTEIKDEIKDCITDKIVLLKCKEVAYHGISDINDVKDWIICGYRVEDLVVIAERLRKDKVDPRVLRADNETFLEGYKQAYDELQASIEKSLESIIGGANNSL